MILELFVYIKKGDEVEEDCSCNSTFMLATMDEVGRAIRSYFFWVPATTIVYLIIDNTGGHSTNDAIEQYHELLFRMYKVQLLHQVPNSPETNLLDLGVWTLRSSLSITIMIQMYWTKLCNKDGFNSQQQLLKRYTNAGF